MSNTEYLDQLKACVDVIGACNGAQESHPGRMENVIAEIQGLDMSTYPSVVKSHQDKAARNTACEQYLAFLFIIGACNVRYGAMKRYFYYEYLKGKDVYPKKYEAALK